MSKVCNRIASATMWLASPFIAIFAHRSRRLQFSILAPSLPFMYGAHTTHTQSSVVSLHHQCICYTCVLYHTTPCSASQSYLSYTSPPPPPLPSRFHIWNSWHGIISASDTISQCNQQMGSCIDIVWHVRERRMARLVSLRAVCVFAVNV